jgi:hypothetical protein
MVLHYVMAIVSVFLLGSLGVMSYLLRDEKPQA